MKIFVLLLALALCVGCASVNMTKVCGIEQDVILGIQDGVRMPIVLSGRTGAIRTLGFDIITEDVGWNLSFVGIEVGEFLKDWNYFSVEPGTNGIRIRAQDEQAHMPNHKNSVLAYIVYTVKSRAQGKVPVVITNFTGDIQGIDPCVSKIRFVSLNR